MKPLIIFTLLLLLPLQAADKVALVIGNAKYQDMPLANAARDAGAVAASLKALGFKVIHKQDLKSGDFRKAVSEFHQAMTPGCVAWFYYAGHGVQVDQSNYLLPVGQEFKTAFMVKDRGIRASMVLDAMAEGRAGLKIMVLDSCRDNPFGKSHRSAGGGGLATMNPPEGTLIAFATAPGKTADDGEGNHSPYTQQLLAELSRKGALEVKTVFQRTARGVYLKTKQDPWLHLSGSVSHFDLRTGKFTTLEQPTDNRETATAGGPTTDRAPGSNNTTSPDRKGTGEIPHPPEFTSKATVVYRNGKVVQADWKINYAGRDAPQLMLATLKDGNIVPVRVKNRGDIKRISLPYVGADISYSPTKTHQFGNVTYASYGAQGVCIVTPLPEGYKRK